MPEKPEVITVTKMLYNKIKGKTIKDVAVYWDNIIEKPSVLDFKKRITNQIIEDITCRGKWIMITLTKDVLLIHLRMEGKFFFREKNETRNKHEHVIFSLDDGTEWRYHDVRKFGKMCLIDREKVEEEKPLLELGLEFYDSKLTVDYLQQHLKRKSIPIKTSLLDQSIITGIGNIYDDEILFLSKINPLGPSNAITKVECKLIIENTIKVLNRAIELGGTTIRSYTSEEGVHGLFQNELLVHGKKECPVCHEKIEKIFIGGRGTYFCSKCQNSKN